MAFKSKLKIVEDLTVTSPCPVESFENNSKVLNSGWYCNQCSKEVYDLKKLSRKEIANLIKSKNGQFCAVISRRLDGSLITKEPISATHSLASAGLLLASTTLINSPAIAQSERGDVAPPPAHETEVTRTVGEAMVRPTATPGAEQPVESSSASSECQEHANTSEQAVPYPTPDIVSTAGGISVPMERGKIAVNPRK